MLSNIGYDLDAPHPYKHIVPALAHVRAVMSAAGLNYPAEERERLGGLSWRLLGDSMHTLALVQFAPRAIAVASVELAARLLGIDIPTKVRACVRVWACQCVVGWAAWGSRVRASKRKGRTEWRTCVHNRARQACERTLTRAYTRAASHTLAFAHSRRPRANAMRRRRPRGGTRRWEATTRGASRRRLSTR